MDEIGNLRFTNMVAVHIPIMCWVWGVPLILRYMLHMARHLHSHSLSANYRHTLALL